MCQDLGLAHRDFGAPQSPSFLGWNSDCGSGFCRAAFSGRKNALSIYRRGFLHYIWNMDNKKTLQTIFIFALFVLMFALIVSMLFPFFTVILWTMLLYVLFNPLHKRLVRRLDAGRRLYEFKRHGLAGVFAVGILVVIIGPIAGIVSMLIQQLLAFLEEVEHFIQANPDFFADSDVGRTLTNLVQELGFSFSDLQSLNLREELLGFVQQHSSNLLSMGTSIISGTGHFVVSVLFVIFALYFCFLDGQYLASLVGRAIPIDPKYMATLMGKFVEITRHLFSGYILVALYQGAAAFVIMVIFGVEGALLFSVVLMFASFIPLFGAAIVWIPIGVVMFITDSAIKGVLFLILCGVCVSFLDNFLRPMFLKDRIHVHPLVIFFAILGGIQVFGLNGLLLGPMIVILFFTVLDMLVNSEARGAEGTGSPDKG